MAKSKALQSQQWWEEIGNSTKVRCTVQPLWLDRARWQILPKPKETNNKQSEPIFIYDNNAATSAIRLTAHAELRLAQRNLSIDEIGYVLLYGQTWHKAGAVIKYLRRKDIPGTDQADQRRQRLIGATVVLTADGERVVLTAYRNRRCGLKKIKTKPEYGWN